jgi:two-component system, response regulator PdtaR
LVKGSVVTYVDAQREATDGGAGPVILVVADGSAQALCDELREAGFQAIDASSADEAIEVIRSGVAVAAIVTDVHVPGSIDGFALAAAARSALPDIVLIVLSSAIGDAQRLRLGPFEFIAKPFDVQSLIARLPRRTAPRSWAPPDQPRGQPRGRGRGQA